MRRLILSLYDAAAQVYLPPFFVPTLGVAQRQLQDELRREGSELAKHPGDYALWRLGHWDDESGLIEVEDPPHLVVEVGVLVE